MLRMVVCLSCKQVKKNKSRGLCKQCSRKEWYQNHKGEAAIIKKKWRKLYPEKIKAEVRARHLKLRSSNCLRCGTTESLHFHHINYEKDEGFTLCASCHSKEHHKLRRLVCCSAQPTPMVN